MQTKIEKQQRDKTASTSDMIVMFVGESDRSHIFSQTKTKCFEHRKKVWSNKINFSTRILTIRHSTMPST